MERHKFFEAHSDVSAVLQYSILLNRVLLDVISTLNSANTVRLSWAQLQEHVKRLNSLLDDWQARLPRSEILDLDSTDVTPLPEETYLRLRYIGIRIMINRPALCEPSSLRTNIPDQSAESFLQDKRAAAL